MRTSDLILSLCTLQLGNIKQTNLFTLVSSSENWRISIGSSTTVENISYMIYLALCFTGNIYSVMNKMSLNIPQHLYMCHLTREN